VVAPIDLINFCVVVFIVQGLVVSACWTVCDVLC